MDASGEEERTLNLCFFLEYLGGVGEAKEVQVLEHQFKYFSSIELLVDPTHTRPAAACYLSERFLLSSRRVLPLVKLGFESLCESDRPRKGIESLPQLLYLWQFLECLHLPF